MIKDVTAGLDKAASLQPGHGWVSANFTATTDDVPKFEADAGVKLKDNIDAYADVWAEPTQGAVGADVGVRLANSVDLYAGGWKNSTDAGVTAGLQVTF